MDDIQNKIEIDSHYYNYEEPFNITKICRFCLRNDYLMSNIFPESMDLTSALINEEDNLAKKIERSMNLKITKNDGLPSNLCSSCISKVEMFADFRDQCIDNDKFLRQLILTKNNKEYDDECIEKHDLKTNNLCYRKAIEGIRDFEPDENSMVILVDPEKDYDSTDHNDSSVPPSDSEQMESTIEENSTNTNNLPSIRNEIVQNVFSCKYCDRAFVNFENCQAHENEDHDKNHPHKCNFCQFSCIERNTIIVHIKEVHVTDKPYICVECEKGFGRRSDLKKHTIVHTGVRPYMCPVCNKHFSRNTNLTKHLRIHTGHKPHVCPNCPRSFITKSDLYRHYNIHFDEKLFQCNQCESKFSRKDRLQAHIKKHHLQQLNGLEIGSKNFQKQSIGNRVNVVQNEEADEVNMVIDLDPYTDELNSTEYEHNNHNGFPVPEHIQNLDIVYPDANVSSENFHNNLNNKELTTINKPFSCDQCSNKFSTKTSLKNHKNIHLGIRNHICNICQKAFLRKRELDRHTIIHTGIKRFVCSVCQKRFGRKDKLIRHERIHSENKMVFKCTKCFATYHRKCSLMAHMKLHLNNSNPIQNVDNEKNISYDHFTSLNSSNLENYQ